MHGKMYVLNKLLLLYFHLAFNYLQSANVKGIVTDENNEAVPFA